MKNLSTKELKDKFELYLFNLSDQLEEFTRYTEILGFNFDYSIDSLNQLEKYLLEQNVMLTDDSYNDAVGYLGEVVRRNLGGKWRCSLDKESNGLHYGLPVIYGHSKLDIELSPFHVVKIFILRNKKGHFLKVIENHTG